MTSGIQLWAPSETRKNGANLTRFIQHCVDKGLIDNSDFSTLFDFSITHREAFWSTLWDAVEICGDRGNGPSLIEKERFQDTEWFPGAKLNFAENLLQRNDDSPAIVFWGEREVRRVLSHRELRDSVLRMRGYLRSLGIQSNDIVAGIVPNSPEAIIAMLGATSLGVGWCSVAPEFGPTGILERFKQISPKVLFVGDCYYYKGKKISLHEKSEQVTKELPSLIKTIELPYFGESEEYDSILQSQPDETPFERFPFSHPLYYLFSSGTTGKPKGIIHSAGGTLLEHKKELELHSDLKRDDTIFYQTTCAWMMWNWLVSSLATGSTVALYDGFPLIDDGRILLEFAEKEEIAIFGTNPGYLRALEKNSIVPKKNFSLPKLRTILTTGAPLLPEQFDDIYDRFPSDTCLSSISGGTDIVGCFALGNPLLPVKRGELQSRSLGYKVYAFSEDGESLTNEPGELVCGAPFASMPLGFVNDDEGKRYQEAYFNRFPNIWHHGDKITITNEGGVIVHGRSDDVLNAHGVRIGPAEIYRQVLQFPEIDDAVAVAYCIGEDDIVVLFVTMKDNEQLTDELIKEIKKKLREEESPRHVPAKIIQAPAFPKTMSGKISAAAIRAAMTGKKSTNADALSNPEIIEFYRGLELSTS